MKRLLIFILALTLFSSFAYADLGLEDDVWAYYNMSVSGSLPDATGNGYDGLTVVGATFQGELGLNGGYYCDGTDDYLSMGFVGQFLRQGLKSEGTINLWVETNQTTSLMLFGGRDASVDNHDRLDLRLNTGAGGAGTVHTILFEKNSDAMFQETDSDEGVTDGGRHMITFIINITGTSTGKIYVDGVEAVTSYTGQSNLIFDQDWAQSRTICAWNNQGSVQDYAEMSTYEWGFWNKSLTQAQITALYNTGNILTYPFNIEADNFLVTARSHWDNSNIQNFSAEINGTIYNTTNGTIVTNILASSGVLVNISLFSNDWLNRTYFDYNVSVSPISAILKQTDITLDFYFSNGEKVNFTQINVSNNDTISVSTTSDGSINLFPDSRNITYYFVGGDNVFKNFSESYVFTSKSNTTINITVEENKNYLTFLNANDSLPINNANVTIFYPSGDNISLKTNSLGQINFSWINNNITELGDYSFKFNKFGFQNITLNENINYSNVPFNKTYNITTAKIIINVYNRDGYNLLSGIDVSVAFVELFNETTTTGQVIKANLSIVSGQYTVYVGSEDFKTEQRTFTFTNQEELTLNFYLLNLSIDNIGTLFVTTSDSFFRKITDAPVELLEYSPSDLSFISVSECVTNINSECSFNIELNTKTYYLRATSIIGGELFVAETSQAGEIITTTNEIRNLIFYTRPDFIVSPVDNLIYDITETFISNVSNIVVNFNSFDGSAIEVCIEYFRREGLTYTSITGDTYCLVSSSAIQNIGTSVTLNRSNDYEARVYIKQTNNDINLQTYYYPSITSTGEIFDDDTKGAIILIFWLFALGFALHSKNITLWLILAIILSWAEILIFPLYSIVSVSVIKTLISVFTIIVARKKKDF